MSLLKNTACKGQVNIAQSMIERMADVSMAEITVLIASFSGNTFSK